jgi:hypothetical protein
MLANAETQGQEEKYACKVESRGREVFQIAFDEGS